MDKKKIGIIAAAVIVIAAAAGGGAWYLLKGNGGGGSSTDKVYVESVSSLNSSGSGSQNRYSGVVEAQETWEVNKESEREVKEVFVKEGDTVEQGTPLFEYDMEEAKTEVQQAELELEGMRNEITSLQSQINQLSQEKNAASEEDKFEYTAEIQEKQNSIKQTEYNIESKKVEIQKKKESIEHAVVTSEIAGVVKSINDSGMDSMTGETAAYMTVLAVGDYRVKGTVSETNIQMLSEEQPVILRSRVDEEQTWKGTISKIDTQNEVKNDNETYYDSGSGSEKATKYPFYITLESTEGLMMGQHLFIELDMGQTEQKEGIWLFEGYIVTEGEKSYVWAANDRNRLEKREVELGEYDEELGEYEILSGLKEDDAIAFPMEGLYEGVAAVTDASEVDYDSPLYNQEGEEQPEDGEMPGEDTMPEGGEMPGEDMMLEDGELSDGDIVPEGGEQSEDGKDQEGDGSSEESSETGESEEGGEDFNAEDAPKEGKFAGEETLREGN
ncbi:MAG: efflux RND transporter periplasmic adaptor subunit [Lachnospiraceae bacterium]|nr:efflux RND transporter periplasmic adaptor subunit [Lachnospiraceae bacterium]